ncbi:MAG: crossover junction endodeoxyribonuclease RuvC [Candidatus Omnitrophica bacterium]|nr:crossover junction endodeoxyribonuclease RuvC [Candidatus Omnitrophota bacterium]
MKILGVDPALTVTGYGAIDFKENRLSFLEAGIVKTSSRQTLPQRLDKIYQALTKVISEVRPEVAVLEKVYVHYRHPTTAYILGEVRSVIVLACARNNVPLVEYAATRVKKAVVGQGLASKHQIQRMVANMLRLASIPKYTDITDALALAITHSSVMKVDKIKNDCAYFRKSS